MLFKKIFHSFSARLKKLEEMNNIDFKVEKNDFLIFVLC